MSECEKMFGRKGSMAKLTTFAVELRRVWLRICG
jgi:hypothetical protein